MDRVEWAREAMIAKRGGGHTYNRDLGATPIEIMEDHCKGLPEFDTQGMYYNSYSNDPKHTCIFMYDKATGEMIRERSEHTISIHVRGVEAEKIVQYLTRMLNEREQDED